MAEFITPQEVRDVTQVSGVTDGALIEPFIRTASDKYIRQEFGTAFYAQMVAANNGTPTPEEAALIAQIKPALIWWTLYEALPTLRTRIHNGGIFERSSQDTNPASQVGVDRIMGWARETAVTYQNYMIEFLDTNKTDYPLWDEKCKRKGSNLSPKVIVR
jgi:hypothetical protein